MRVVFYFCVVWLLTACAGKPVAQSDDALLTAAYDMPFSVQGRFSARAEQDAFSAAFDWRHAPERDRIALRSPLGVTQALLMRDDKTVTVSLEDGQTNWRGSDWQTLAQQALGFPLPVDGLVYWIRSLALPEIPAAITRDVGGRVEQLRQNGWQIDYRYASPEAQLPLQLDARYGDAVFLRVRIDNWNTDGQYEQP